MSEQIFHWVVSLAGASIGWILKIVWDAVKDIRKDMHTLEKHAHDTYVRREHFKDALDDMKEDIREIKDDVRNGLNRIETVMNKVFDKLDQKQDKE